MREFKYIFILLVISVFLYFFALGNMPITDPDESFYAQTAKEMYQQKEWVTPMIFGQAQFEKPVFYYWLVILCYIFMGVSEFSARFPSAVFGCIGIIGVYLLGRIFFSKRSAFLASLIMATSSFYMVLARACVTDMVLTVFILYTIMFFFMGWTREKKIYYFLSSVCAAFAVLTKGPIGLLIPGAAILIYVVFTNQWRKFFKVPFLWCIFFFLIVSSPWYIAVTKVHGMQFIGEFFGFQNITRFLHPEHRIGTSPFFYIPVVLGGFFPWTLFIPAAVWYMFTERDVLNSKVKGSVVLLVAWFLFVFLFFSISRTKLVTYIFPLFPAVALSLGVLWDGYFDEKIKRCPFSRFMKASFWSFIILNIVGIVGIYSFSIYEYGKVFKGTEIPMIIMALVMVISAFFFTGGKKQLSFYAIICGIMILMIPLSVYVLPEAGSLESSKTLSLQMREIGLDNTLVGGENDLRRGIAFYTDKTDIVDIHPYNDLVSFSAGDEKVLGIIKRKHFDQLIREKGDVAYSISETGSYVLFTNKAGKEK